MPTSGVTVHRRHNDAMSARAPQEPAPLSEREMHQLQDRLDAVPEPLQALDVSALDGFLCGMLLLPQDVPAATWLPYVTDLEGGALPPGFDAAPLHALVLRRHAELRRAIAARQWFDPWIFELDAAASPSDSVLPWVAGFAAAMDRFPALMQHGDPALMEPLALIYLHFDPQDLDDADELQAVIDTIEPPSDLGDAVQDLVRSVMLMADITRPRPPVARSAPRRRR